MYSLNYILYEEYKQFMEINLMAAQRKRTTNASKTRPNRTDMEWVGIRQSYRAGVPYGWEWELIPHPQYGFHTHTHTHSYGTMHQQFYSVSYIIFYCCLFYPLLWVKCKRFPALCLDICLQCVRLQHHFVIMFAVSIILLAILLSWQFDLKNALNSCRVRG